MICIACGATLTPDEEHYYGMTCDRCEREWTERITAWRHGAPDAELDKMFGALTIPKPTLQ